MHKRITHIALFVALAHLVGHSIFPHKHIDYGVRTFITQRSNPSNIIQLIENALSVNIGFEHLKFYNNTKPLMIVHSDISRMDVLFSSHFCLGRISNRIWFEFIALFSLGQIFHQLAFHAINGLRGPPTIPY